MQLDPAMVKDLIITLQYRLGLGKLKD